MEKSPTRTKSVVDDDNLDKVDLYRIRKIIATIVKNADKNYACFSLFIDPNYVLIFV